MAFSIRDARLDDGEFVMALFAVPELRTFTRGPASIEKFREAVKRVESDPDRHILIVERDGEPFGGANYHVTGGWLMDIGFIGFKQQRTGAGLFTMHYLVDVAFEKLHLHRAFLEVVAENTGARRLYEKIGFRREGRYVDGYRDNDGIFHDLLPYGMISPEPLATTKDASGV